MLAGPNRGGKSTAGAVELICYATGWNPFRNERYETGTLNWAVPRDAGKMAYIVRKKLFQLLPPEGPYTWRYWRQEGIIEFKKPLGGSEIHIMSADAGPSKFAGAGVRGVWIDEEPLVHGEEIFEEITSRKEPGQELNLVLTFTPQWGFTWTWRRLWNEKSDELVPGVDRFTFTLWDASISNGGWWTDEEIEQMISRWSPYQRKARAHGQYGIVGGDPYFDPEHIAQARSRTVTGKRARITVDALGQTKLEYVDESYLFVFEERQQYVRYSIGIDLSGGGMRDRTVAYVIRNDNLKCVARFKSSMIDPEQFARSIAYPLARYYWNAMIIPEANGLHGGAFITALKPHYGNIYAEQKFDKLHHVKPQQQGWLTTEKSRGMILAAHERALRENTWQPTSSLLDELETMVIVQRDSGEPRIDHVSNAHDDEVFAAGVALAVRYARPPVKERKREEMCELWSPESFTVGAR